MSLKLLRLGVGDALRATPGECGGERRLDGGGDRVRREGEGAMAGEGGRAVEGDLGVARVASVTSGAE